MRIGLDTNVIVSAVAARGLCADLFQVILLEHELVIGETVLVELRRVLSEKFHVPDATIKTLEGLLRRQAAIVAAESDAAIDGLDSADTAVLHEAAAGSVDVFVTGDRELQDLRQSAVQIVSPRGLWDMLRRAT